MSKYTNTTNSLFMLVVIMVGLLFIAEGVILQAGYMSVVDILFGVLLVVMAGLTHNITSTIKQHT